jgi:hypothetical protein
MSVASAYLPIQTPAIYRRSSATASLPIPPIAIRGSSSITRPNADRSGLLLGSSLLSEDPVFSAFFQKVQALQEDTEEDVPPDSQALAEILRLVPFSRNQLAQRWPSPRVASDGFGGVRLTWRNKQYELRAVVSGGQTTRGSYLYWEDENGYGTVPNFTATTLFMFLDRLEKAAPFER